MVLHCASCGVQRHIPGHGTLIPGDTLRVSPRQAPYFIELCREWRGRWPIIGYYHGVTIVEDK